MRLTICNIKNIARSFNIIFTKPYRLMHLEFNIQEILPERFANLITNQCIAQVCLYDLQIWREIFPVL